jgi:hypothetical protein
MVIHERILSISHREQIKLLLVYQNVAEIAKNVYYYTKKRYKWVRVTIYNTLNTPR